MIHEGVGVEGGFFFAFRTPPLAAALAHTSRLGVHGVKIAGRERSRAFKQAFFLFRHAAPLPKTQRADE